MPVKRLEGTVIATPVRHLVVVHSSLIFCVQNRFEFVDIVDVVIEEGVVSEVPENDGFCLYKQSCAYISNALADNV